MSSLKIFSINPHSTTAGISGDKSGERIEIFLSGCRMAREGHPCPGCFNSQIWDSKFYKEQTIEQLLEWLSKYDNKYLTIVGGEPLDQMPDLVEFCKALHEKYHIVLITHYTLFEIMAMDKGQDLIWSVDLLIDGKYDQELRIFDTDMRPGIKHVVGSSNQRLYSLRDHKSIIDITNEQDMTQFYI